MGVSIDIRAASTKKGKPRKKTSGVLSLILRRWAVAQRFLIQKAFQTGGHKHHGGRQWRKLAKSTIAKKGHDTILVETGALSKSIRQSVSVNDLRASVRFYSEKTYANYHDRGGEGGNPPKRPIFVVTRKDRKRLALAMREGVREDLLRAPKITKKAINL